LTEQAKNMNEQKSNYYIPAAIILAGFIVATGIYLSNKGNSPAPVVDTNQNNSSNIVINPVSVTDHILGNPNAPITLVEFSDTECPYCKMFQSTMDLIKGTYIKDGTVAWVYRHFPLDSIHPKTRKEAEATECVNELGGQTAFWKMLDTIYTNTPSNNQLDPAKLPEFAKSVGVDVTKFNDCLASGKYAATVEADLQDGKNAGAQGTPYSVLVLKTALSSSAESTLTDFIVKNGLAQNVIISSDKKDVVLSGALRLDMVNAIIDAILNK